MRGPAKMTTCIAVHGRYCPCTPARRLTLDVSENSPKQLARYLDRQQSGEGRFYGRHTAGKEPHATAVGLLGRLVSGWKLEDPRLGDGAAFLTKTGPAEHAAEYNAIASLVLFQLQGEPYQKWNRELRPLILKRQIRKGDLRGSWFDKDDVQSKVRGRLCQTALNVMVLQIYYRFLQIHWSSAS